MSRGSRVASAFVLIAIVSAPLARAQTTPDPNTIRVFRIEYADGRTIRYPVREKGSNSWTAAFPRVPGAQTESDGLALTALEIGYVVEGRDLVVAVALRYGTPHQKRVPVITFKLSDDHPAHVDELTAFGVQPIILAIESFARPQLQIPAVILPSSLLEAKVDANAPGEPKYLISITNHAQQGVMALAFEAYHGNTKGMSGKPHAMDHTPLIAPGGVYTMVLQTSVNGRATDPSDLWPGVDRIVFTSVTWSDGIVEGSERPAVETRVVDAATARELDRALTLLRDAQATGAPDLPQLRTAISSLSIDDDDAVRPAASGSSSGVNSTTARSLTRIGMQLAKDALMKDFDEFLRDPRSGDPVAQRAWLMSAVSKFDGWRLRIVAPSR
jgi:hypothetical protein